MSNYQIDNVFPSDDRPLKTDFDPDTGRPIDVEVVAEVEEPEAPAEPVVEPVKKGKKSEDAS